MVIAENVPLATTGLDLMLKFLSTPARREGGKTEQLRALLHEIHQRLNSMSDALELGDTSRRAQRYRGLRRQIATQVEQASNIVQEVFL